MFTEITQERYNALKEVLRRMEENRYSKVQFADEDELVRLLRARKGWEKEKTIGEICIEIKDEQKRKEYNAYRKEIDDENARIHETYIKPLDAKIQVLEVELMLYNGIFQMRDTSQGIHKRVYPRDDED